MRGAAVVSGILCLMATGLAAQTSTVVWPAEAGDDGRLHLPQDELILYRDRLSPSDDNVDFRTLSLPPQPIVPISHPVLSIGAFQLHLGGDDTRAHVAHYDFEGRRVLGGTVTGNFDGRAATIRLRWPTHE